MNEVKHKFELNGEKLFLTMCKTNRRKPILAMCSGNTESPL
jgi:hypothetical protein